VLSQDTRVPLGLGLPHNCVPAPAHVDDLSQTGSSQEFGNVSVRVQAENQTMRLNR